MSRRDAIQPGAMLGVFGGGQLGRMFATAAARLGYRVGVYAPEPDSPAAHVAHEHVCAPYEDEHAVDRFAERCAAVTIEFENVPVWCLERAAARAPARPGPEVLAVAQDRLHERMFLDRHGLPTARHELVRSADELRVAARRVGTPGVLKSARGGYDGRGQVRLADADDAPDAWRQLATDRAIYEAWVDYRCEVSVLVARSPRGQVVTFGPIENNHANHILDVSVVPARVEPRTAQHAVELACGVAEALQLEGLICVEMFVLDSGELVINELAPRPHNSGHLTIEACVTSQFEQQVRAMCNLPLGDMGLRGEAAAMVNLLGDLWGGGEPDWPGVLASPGAHLHLYGKSHARPGRKMGHLTVVDSSPDAASRRARDLRRSAARAARGAEHADDAARPQPTEVAGPSR